MTISNDNTLTIPFCQMPKLLQRPLVAHRHRSALFRRFSSIPNIEASRVYEQIRADANQTALLDDIVLLSEMDQFVPEAQAQNTPIFVEVSTKHEIEDSSKTLHADVIQNDVVIKSPKPPLNDTLDNGSIISSSIHIHAATETGADIKPDDKQDPSLTNVSKTQRNQIVSPDSNEKRCSTSEDYCPTARLFDVPDVVRAVEIHADNRLVHKGDEAVNASVYHDYYHASSSNPNRTSLLSVENPSEQWDVESLDQIRDSVYSGTQGRILTSSNSSLHRMGKVGHRNVGRVGKRTKTDSIYMNNSTTFEPIETLNGRAPLNVFNPFESLQNESQRVGLINPFLLHEQQQTRRVHAATRPPLVRTRSSINREIRKVFNALVFMPPTHRGNTLPPIYHHKNKHSKQLTTRLRKEPSRMSECRPMQQIQLDEWALDLKSRGLSENSNVLSMPLALHLPAILMREVSALPNIIFKKDVKLEQLKETEEKMRHYDGAGARLDATTHRSPMWISTATTQNLLKYSPNELHSYEVHRLLEGCERGTTNIQYREPETWLPASVFPVIPKLESRIDHPDADITIIVHQLNGDVVLPSRKIIKQNIKPQCKPHQRLESVQHQPFYLTGNPVDQIIKHSISKLHRVYHKPEAASAKPEESELRLGMTPSSSQKIIFKQTTPKSSIYLQEEKTQIPLMGSKTPESPQMKRSKTPVRSKTAAPKTLTARTPVHQIPMPQGRPLPISLRKESHFPTAVSVAADFLSFPPISPYPVDASDTTQRYNHSSAQPAASRHRRASLVQYSLLSSSEHANQDNRNDTSGLALKVRPLILAACGSDGDSTYGVTTKESVSPILALPSIAEEHRKRIRTLATQTQINQRGSNSTAVALQSPRFGDNRHSNTKKPDAGRNYDGGLHERTDRGNNQKRQSSLSQVVDGNVKPVLSEHMHNVAEGIQYVDSAIIRIQKFWKMCMHIRKWNMRTLAAITIQRRFRGWRVQQRYFECIQLRNVNRRLEITPYITAIYEIDKAVSESQSNRINRFYKHTITPGTIQSPTKTMLFVFTRTIFRHYFHFKTRPFYLELYLAVPSTRKQVWDLYTLIRTRILNKYTFPPNVKFGAKREFSALGLLKRAFARQPTLPSVAESNIVQNNVTQNSTTAIKHHNSRLHININAPPNVDSRRMSSVKSFFPASTIDAASATIRKLSNIRNSSSMRNFNSSSDGMLKNPDAFRYLVNSSSIEYSPTIGSTTKMTHSQTGLHDSNENTESFANLSDKHLSRTEIALVSTFPQEKLSSLVAKKESELIMMAMEQLRNRKYAPEDVIELVRKQKPDLIPIVHNQRRRNSKRASKFLN